MYVEQEQIVKWKITSPYARVPEATLVTPFETAGNLPVKTFVNQTHAETELHASPAMIVLDLTDLFVRVHLELEEILWENVPGVNANTTTNVDLSVPATTFDAQTHAQMHADNKHNVEHATMEQFVHVQGDLLEILQLLAVKTETATITGIGVALVANVAARMSSEPVAIEDSLTRSLHHSFKLDDKMANHTFF